jgi:hypothetical protein
LTAVVNVSSATSNFKLTIGNSCRRERGANEVFTGGISSYSVFNMVRVGVVEMML